MRAESAGCPRPIDQRARVLSTEPSTEPLAREALAAGEASPRCSACNSPIAGDQRYCLECGERLAPISGFLWARARTGPRSSGPPRRHPTPRRRRTRQQPHAAPLLGVLAGVGLLLLAMGVGVLIGRAGNSHRRGQARGDHPGGPPRRERAPPKSTFTSDWPASRSGYTVQLSTLPSIQHRGRRDGRQGAPRRAKGAPAVGALASSEFSSLPSGSYVIYSGVYHSAGEAQKALARLRAKFPAAKTIHVSGGGSRGGGSSGSSSNGGSSGGSSHGGGSLSHPAPSSTLKSLKGKGKNYVEASKNLPDVVETG